MGKPQHDRSDGTRCLQRVPSRSDPSCCGSRAPTAHMRSQQSAVPASAPVFALFNFPPKQAPLERRFTESEVRNSWTRAPVFLLGSQPNARSQIRSRRCAPVFTGGPRRERGVRFYLSEEHNVKKLWIPALLALALAALVVPAQAGAVTFPDGVASGDVTSTRAILVDAVGHDHEHQGRGLDERLAEPPEGVHRASSRRPPPATARSRSTHAASRRTRSTGTASRRTRTSRPWARSRPRPRRTRSANVKFTWTGDSDGNRVNGVNPFNNWETLPARAERERRLLRLPRRHDLLGLELPHGRPATTLADYRGATGSSARTRT